VSIYVALHHVTHYKYDRPIDLGPQTIRLRPAPHTRTPVLSYSLKVTPTNHFVNWQQDPQGNWLARFVFPEKASELKIEVDFTAQMTVVNPFDFFVEPYAFSFPFAYTNDLKTELAPYLATTEQGPLFAAYLRTFRARPTAPSISWSSSTRNCRRQSATSSAWSRASRRRRRRSPRAPDRAATPHGC
jgi:transglutaminase-like putative cysteine protease